MNDESITDKQLAADIRTAVARLNDALAAAARRGLTARLRTASHQVSAHQTSGGAELVVVEADNFKKL
jgi:hypothetical protein